MGVTTVREVQQLLRRRDVCGDDDIGLLARCEGEELARERVAVFGRAGFVGEVG